MVWLLELTFAGRVWRYASEDVTVGSDDGDLDYSGDLEIDPVREDMDLFSIAISGLEVPVTFTHLPGMAGLVAKGHDPASATGELSQWIEGSAYEARRVVLRGRLTDPEWGEDFLVGTLTQASWDDRGRMPDPAAEVNADTTDTTNVSSSDAPLAYPLVFGRPGNDAVTRQGYYGGTPALWLDKTEQNPVVVIAGHRVQATQVYLVHDDDTVGRRYVVTHTTDRLGRTIATVQAGTGGGTTLDHLAVHPNEEYNDGLVAGPASFIPDDVNTTLNLFVAWRDETDSTLGALAGDDGALLRGGGDLLLYVLRNYSSLPVDYGRTAAALPQLNAFLFDGYIDDGCVPWDWLSTNILPLLPCSVVRGPDGLFPIVWNPDARECDAVAVLDEDLGDFEFGDRVTSDAGNVTNDFTLRYGYNARTQTYAHTARLGATYVAPTARAVATLIVPGALARIPVWAKAGGTEGAAIEIVYNDDGTDPPTLTEVPTLRQVVINFKGLLTGNTATFAQITSTIRASSTLITCAASTVSDLFEGASSAPDPTQYSPVYTRLLDDGTKPHHACFVSKARYADPANGLDGVFPEELETRYITDKATAEAVLGWRARAHAFAIRRVEGIGPFSRFGHLQCGDDVVVNCSRLGLGRRMAVIESVETSTDGDVAFSLVMVENSARDSRT
jgi:hypothetical protein